MVILVDQFDVEMVQDGGYEAAVLSWGEYVFHVLGEEVFVDWGGG